MSSIERRPGPSVRARVTELADGRERAREDRLAAEEPLEIRLAWPGTRARRIWVTMRTPGHDFELAAGYLCHEGLASGDQIAGVAYCTDRDLTAEQELNVVTVTLDSAPARETTRQHGGVSAGSSACGVCGKDTVLEALAAPRGDPWSGPWPTASVIRSLPGTLREAQALFARTGGVHAAGLADETGRFLVVREDVGRHNAVDKVTGARLLAGQRPAAAVLALSGRIGFELVQKAAAAGVGTVAAVGAPTSLAVQYALSAGLRVYGFTSERRTVRYA
ncbi:MAG: formate dehydrogenase accessory sulfurtransferase FdhD [Nocardioides sp.]